MSWRQACSLEPPASRVRRKPLRPNRAAPRCGSSMRPFAPTGSANITSTPATVRRSSCCMVSLRAWDAWRKQIPVLGEKYRLIVPYLRGYGDTDKPDRGYDKRTMAEDIRALMLALGIKRAPILGHDRGARVATRFAKDHPEMIERLGVFDNIPTRIIFKAMDAAKAKGHWFFIFSQAPDGLPEALIAGKEEVWLRYMFSHWSYDPTFLKDEELAVYVTAYQQAGAVHGACNDYRAGAEDIVQDEADADVKISCPTLALWGQDFDEVGRMWDVEGVWKQMATNLSAVSIPECGHLCLEEKPDDVNRELLKFLADWHG